MAARAAQRDPEQLLDETTVEQQGPAAHAPSVTGGIPGASLDPRVPPALAVPSRQAEANAGEPLPTRAERAERLHTGSERSRAPSSHWLDSIEALLPGSGVDESRDDTPSSARRPASQEIRTKENREAIEGELLPWRDGRSTASPYSEERQRAPGRRQPEVGQPASSASASAPEIHIHIGRVELTALQAAPAKSTPRSIGKKPMSLDDYLRQRNGRRS
jgi:hypothetical protein